VAGAAHCYYRNMNDAEYAHLRRRLLRDGELPNALYGELREVVRRLVRRRALPPAFAPYGEWNDEAIDEVFQGWATRRLIGLGHLRPLVARSGDLRIFRGRAERSLRQFLLNERDRTQAENLFARLSTLLNEDDAFCCFIEATRSQNRWWGLAQWRDPEPFAGEERVLHAAAWAVGELAVIRYRADALKLSPVLDANEIKRFTVVVLETLRALVRIPHLLDALRARIDLDQGPTLPLALIEDRPSPGAVDDVGLGELAQFAYDQLTDRQAAILAATAAERPLAEIGAELGCAPATVLNDQRRIGALLTRLTGDDQERATLLNLIVDLQYEQSDHDA
jgi:DNA-binding CsgD family transcriptional regulator